MDREAQWRQHRSTFVGIILTGILAAGILAFSFLVCGGFALYAAGIVFAFTLLGYVHYFLWGRGMMHEVADERRAEEMRRRLEAEAWPRSEDDEPHDFRRF